MKADSREVEKTVLGTNFFGWTRTYQPFNTLAIRIVSNPTHGIDRVGIDRSDHGTARTPLVAKTRWKRVLRLGRGVGTTTPPYVLVSGEPVSPAARVMLTRSSSKATPRSQEFSQALERGFLEAIGRRRVGRVFEIFELTKNGHHQEKSNELSNRGLKRNLDETSILRRWFYPMAI